MNLLIELSNFLLEDQAHLSNFRQQCPNRYIEELMQVLLGNNDPANQLSLEGFLLLEINPSRIASTHWSKFILEKAIYLNSVFDR